MAVTEKYQSLIDLANQNSVANLQIAEQDEVLYITGSTGSGTEILAFRIQPAAAT